MKNNGYSTYLSPSPNIPLVLCRVLFSVLLGISVVIPAYAIDATYVAENKRTILGLYFTPEEADRYMMDNGLTTLFIDARDPVEVSFTGMPASADANVPFVFISPIRRHLQSGIIKNRYFITGIDNRLRQKGLDRKNVIILMCRSGVQSAKVSDVLANAGYTKVFSLVRGYKGVSIKEDPNKVRRSINGWKNAGLAWNPPQSLDIHKMYRHPQPVISEKITTNTTSKKNNM